MWRWSPIAFSESTVALFAAIVVFGATVGNILMLQPLLIAERFGVVDYPRIFSRSQFIMMLGTALGPLVLGWLHDNAGGYRTSYLVAAGCSIAGAAVLASGGAATMVDDRQVQLVDMSEHRRPGGATGGRTGAPRPTRARSRRASCSPPTSIGSSGSTRR